MLFWIFLGLQIGIFVLASVSDYIWNERMNPPAHPHRVGCRCCAQGNLSVEVFGLWVHQFKDRWISCPSNNHPHAEVTKVKVGVTEQLSGAVAWQSDSLT
jgi:hypothetical protein